MACDVCGRTGSHDSRCPNYVPPKADHYCSICGDGIYKGEEYLGNPDGEYIHYECIQGLRQLLEWLGYKIQTMDELNQKFQKKRRKNGL